MVCIQLIENQGSTKDKTNTAPEFFICWPLYSQAGFSRLSTKLPFSFLCFQLVDQKVIYGVFMICFGFVNIRYSKCETTSITNKMFKIITECELIKAESIPYIIPVINIHWC